MAKRFGDGEWSVRAARSACPEFVPLARAFNRDGGAVAERDRELVPP